MNTSFEEIYTIFLNKISDFEIASLEDDEIAEYCERFLVSALSKIHNLTNDLTDRDDFEFSSELTDIEKEIITCQMVVEWIDSKLNTSSLLTLFVGTKDENMASQANFINALSELKDKQRSTVNTLMRNYQFRKFVEEGENK